MDLIDLLIKSASTVEQVEFSWEMPFRLFIVWVLDLPLYMVAFAFILVLSVVMLIKCVSEDLKRWVK